MGYGGQLNIRPKYQREFVYDEKKRNAVIETIRRDFPLNVMYWVVTDQGHQLGEANVHHLPQGNEGRGLGRSL